MTKKCICKDGMTDPKCPACNDKVDYLKDFHKLNPEAKPTKKTAGMFNAPAKGFFGGMDPAMKARLLQGAQSAAPMLAAGVPAAALAAATADKGEGAGDAARAALLAGGTAAAAHFGHNMMMGGSSPLAHSYQRGIGTDIRNVANKGREAMGMPTVAPARPPKVASLETLKIANPEDPYAGYGQYGHEQQDSGPSLGSMLAMGGLGVLGARALHGGLMSSRGQFARGYQANLGNAIRAATNRARTGVGMPTVPLAPTGLKARAMDLAHDVGGAVGNAREMVQPAIETGTKAMAGAAVLRGAHKDLMNAGHPLGNAYSKYVGGPAEKAVGSVKDKLTQWANKPSNAAPSANMGGAPEKMQAAPERQTKPGATRYQAYVPGKGRVTPSAPTEKKKAPPTEKKSSLSDFLIAR